MKSIKITALDTGRVYEQIVTSVETAICFIEAVWEYEYDTEKQKAPEGAQE